MTWIDITTLAIAVLGAVLGIYNAFRAWWKDIARLKVECVKVRFEGGDEPDRLAVKVINTGFIAVTVYSAGFCTWQGVEKDGWAMKLARKLLRLRPQGHIALVQNQRQYIPLPQRLEPRSAVLLLTEHGTDFPTVSNHPRCYACTDCGLVAYGSGKVARASFDLVLPKPRDG